MIYVPDNSRKSKAIARTTHLGIAAHHDDLEIMAFHGIIECLSSDEKWFGGVICTDGSKSPRSGPYTRTSDSQMAAIRIEEQNKAADLGKYSLVSHLGIDSRKVKEITDSSLMKELQQIIVKSEPDVIYTHNPADRHATHIAVLQATVAALRSIAYLPTEFYGCEVWRDLDWLSPEDKFLLNVSGEDELAAQLLAVFESQVSGGKDYVAATLGRRAANATFSESHRVDDADQVSVAIDLLPLLQDHNLEIIDFIGDKISHFRADVMKKLSR